MKIQFNPKQQYQIDAANAVVDIFDGQPITAKKKYTKANTAECTGIKGNCG